ncbi:MAG: ABC transporter ATP-binding protein [Actinobacteria bacterium]|nr:ABC transporter ATP-binding protein [Actinomycetota bacterium]
MARRFVMPGVRTPNGRVAELEPAMAGAAKATASGRAARDLVVSNVRKAFDRTEVLHGVDLHVPEGAFATMLGPSGSGKTTVLRIVAGFERPDAGTVTLGGKDLTALAPRARGLGMVFQSYALFPHLTVEDNIAYPLRVRRMKAAERRRRVAEYAGRVQLEPYLGRYPHELSGGQQQRVALARALVFEPRLLLLDEPLGALDKRLRTDIQEQLKELHREIGITFIHVTHDQAEAFALSTLVVIMRDGGVEQAGAPEQLFHEPATLFVADFVGGANAVPATLLERGVHGAHLQLHDGRRLRVPPAQVAPGVGASGDVTLVFRPDAGTTLASGDEHPGDDVLTLAGTVRDVTYLGGKYELSLDGGGARARVHSGAAAAIGATVHACWALDCCRVVGQPDGGG